MKNTQIEIKHSKMNMASYGSAKALNEFMDMAFMLLGFYFYETVIGLDTWFVAFGYILFAAWNAINDPLVGFLTNRPFKFTKKWGRRFPWISIGGLLWVISYILIFIPPAVDPVSGAWILFAWLVFATCLYDTFQSVFFVNFASLFPDKFRSIKERRTTNLIATMIGILGVVLGAVLPGLFISFENVQSYIIQAGAMIIGGIVILALSIPGCREDQVTIDRYLATHDKRERLSFFGTMKKALKQQSFVVFIIAYIFYRSLVVCVQSSLAYLVDYDFQLEPIFLTFLMASFLFGALISIPFWMLLAHKTDNNKNVITIAGFALTIFTIPLIFITDFYIFLIAVFLWGVGLGGFWVLLSPVFADVIDDSIVKTGKREEGIYNGFQQFFGRIALILQALTFAIVHEMTGFMEGAPSQSPAAIFGIRIHLALVPMIFMLVASIIFLLAYKLTPEKTKANQEKIKEMGL